MGRKVKEIKLASLVGVLLLPGLIAAQPPTPSWRPDAEAFWPQVSIGPSEAAMDASSAQAAGFSLGQPGLSFRHVQTFGVTEEPFLPSNNHFYFVEGIGTVANTVWIGDHLGRRRCADG